MQTMTHAYAEHQLAQLAQRLDHWRRCRTTPRSRIPQPLWDQAVSLAAVLPVSRVAKRLRLSTNDLKKRCAAKPAARSAEAPPAALGFVEVPAAAVWPIPTPSTEIELQRADGARLRIHAHELQLSIAALVRTFLETT
jgi:hypothetical protein